jgi:hypothetical protein
VTVAHRRHNIHIIGDSHFRGLSDMVSSGLSDAFSVIGFSKLNANTEGITSSLYTSIDNLTRERCYHILQWNQIRWQE